MKIRIGLPSSTQRRMTIQSTHMIRVLTITDMIIQQERCSTTGGTWTIIPGKKHND